jgi:hypothetical protein
MWKFINMKINKKFHKDLKIIKILIFYYFLKRENLYLASLWKGCIFKENVRKR